MLQHSLKDQVAIIFGGTGIIGSAVVKLLAANGIKVVVNYCHREEVAYSIVNDVVKNGGIAKALQADIVDVETVKSLMNEVKNIFGRIDIVVNTIHGRGSTPKLISNMEWIDWAVHLDALKAHFNICKNIIPHMRKQKYGRIVFISGGLAYRFHRGCSAYTTIKAGLEGFCKTMAIEEGEYNTTVNIVAPGKVVPDNVDNFNYNPGLLAEFEREQMSKNPLKRFATANDVANAVLYFVSPGSSCITGQTLFITGGEVIR